jgi:hypothetical protein
MSGQPEITQRDLRNKSREIMGAVESGQAAFRADQNAAADDDAGIRGGR